MFFGVLYFHDYTAAAVKVSCVSYYVLKVASTTLVQYDWSIVDTIIREYYLLIYQTL